MLKLTKKTAYLMLFVSIIFEQFATGCLTACKGFTVALPTIGLIISYIICFWCFAQVLDTINLGVSYATWTVMGTIGASLMGIFLFNQTISLIGWISIFGMMIGVVLVNVYGTPQEAAASASARASESAAAHGSAAAPAHASESAAANVKGGEGKC